MATCTTTSKPSRNSGQPKGMSKHSKSTIRTSTNTSHTTPNVPTASSTRTNRPSATGNSDSDTMLLSLAACMKTLHHRQPVSPLPTISSFKTGLKKPINYALSYPAKKERSMQSSWTILSAISTCAKGRHPSKGPGRSQPSMQATLS